MYIQAKLCFSDKLDLLPQQRGLGYAYFAYRGGGGPKSGKTCFNAPFAVLKEQLSEKTLFQKKTFYSNITLVDPFYGERSYATTFDFVSFKTQFI